jgi:hypothetical protein
MILDVQLQVLLRVRFCSKYVFEKCLRIHDFEKDFRSDFVQRLCLGFEVWAARKIEREKRKEWEETEESRHSIPHKSKY